MKHLNEIKYESSTQRDLIDSAKALQKQFYKEEEEYKIYNELIEIFKNKFDEWNKNKT